MQVKVSHCLSPAQDYLVGCTKRSTLVTAYAEPGCMQERPCCEPRLVATSTRPAEAQQKALGTLRPATTCQMPLRLK